MLRTRIIPCIGVFNITPDDPNKPHKYVPLIPPVNSLNHQVTIEAEWIIKYGNKYLDSYAATLQFFKIPIPSSETPTSEEPLLFMVFSASATELNPTSLCVMSEGYSSLCSFGTTEGKSVYSDTSWQFLISDECNKFG
jgi:hypothetical protein